VRTFCQMWAERVPSGISAPSCATIKPTARVQSFKAPGQQGMRATAIITLTESTQIYNHLIEYLCGRSSILVRNVLQAHQQRHSHGNID